MKTIRTIKLYTTGLTDTSLQIDSVLASKQDGNNDMFIIELNITRNGLIFRKRETIKFTVSWEQLDQVRQAFDIGEDDPPKDYGTDILQIIDNKLTRL